MAKRRATKREEALARNAEWAKLTPQQQLASLGKRRLTAKKQRAKIHKLMEKQ